MNQGKLLVFSKAPIPGMVKTRLIPDLGVNRATRLHRYLLLQTLETAQKLSSVSTELWCAPDSKHDFFQSCAKQYPLNLKQQRGNDLGEKMQDAFERTLADTPWAILIGTDCPDLNVHDIEQAMEFLELGADAVAGPAHDGGYYLLGLRKTDPSLFDGIPWGSDQVWNLTQKKLQKLNWKYSLLRTQHDLDRIEDLKRFPSIQPGLG